MKKLIKNGIEYYTFEIFNKAEIIHGFPTKKGGYSKGDFESLNFFYSTDDDHETVNKNYKKFFETFEIDKFARGKQTHSKNVTVATEGNCSIYFENNDGFLSEEDITLITFHADCGSVFIYDLEKNVFGMLHSGWMGTSLNIVKKALHIMVRDFGTNPENIILGIGPSICKNCFETDFDVAEKFLNLGYATYVEYNNEKNKYFIDLKEILKKQAMECGVLEEKIEVATECTMCNKEEFYSHRRDGKKRGGHLGFIKKSRG